MPDTRTQERSGLAHCIELCQACHRACLETMMHCLGRGGAHAAPDHIRMLADCAAICQTSADFMMRGSPFHGAVCAVCAEICDQCAVECDTFADGDATMAACVRTCRRCAESCAAMSGT